MRVEPKPTTKYPFWIRKLFRGQEKKYHAILQPTMLWGRHPRLLALFLLMFKYFMRKKSLLPPDVRSLVMIRVSQLNWCSFCVDLNVSIFMENAGVAEKVDALDSWKQSPLFSPEEKAALAYTDAMTDSSQQVSDAHIAHLRTFLSDDAIVELTALLAYQNMSAKFNAALDVPPQGLCKLPVARQAN
ncbi:MAG: carboxymuconolactone decarboxylase family protein [Bdellovibrionales bacterium]|nr:carboxymuconolactone decarboxylase family protein [Bdellovibrionales bacterium]